MATRRNDASGYETDELEIRHIDLDPICLPFESYGDITNRATQCTRAASFTDITLPVISKLESVAGKRTLLSGHTNASFVHISTAYQVAMVPLKARQVPKDCKLHVMCHPGICRGSSCLLCSPSDLLLPPPTHLSRTQSFKPSLSVIFTP